MLSIKLTESELSSLQFEMTSWYGELEQYKLMRIIDVTEKVIDYYKRVRAFRVDLRFAQDYCLGDFDSPIHFQKADPKAITRFFGSLKSQLTAYRRQKGIFSILDDFKYIWVREKDEVFHHHYHLVLFFNRDIYYPLGDYSSDSSSGLAAMIQKAWCSAINVNYPEYSYLVHFPDNCAYNLERKSAILQNDNYMGALKRFLYLAKMESKVGDDGYRNFGCSQF